MASTHRLVDGTPHEHLVLRIILTSLLLLLIAVTVGYGVGWLVSQGVLDVLTRLAGH